MANAEINLQAIENASPENPVEISDRIWWVGRYLEGDPFQCHAYLIENGDQSILIDPGSYMTIEATLEKIKKILPISDIKYFICHHQGPDVCSAMRILDKLVDRDDAIILTHWRVKELLRHLDIKIPFQLIEEQDWKLDLGDGRVLDFIFTPYAHFPGAFCTFERDTGILFSSDLMGGFTDGFSLLVKDESHFEAIRSFHEHYIPSREVLNYALARFEELPIELIAPQHGSMIPKNLIAPLISKLKTLDCGLYIFTKDNLDIGRLLDLNTLVKETIRGWPR